MFKSILAVVAFAVATAGFAAPAHASPDGGPKQTRDVVAAGGTDVYKVSLRSEESTTVVLSGDGTSCLELRVYDPDGNLLASDTLGLGDDRSVRFYVPDAGRYTIKVRNIGGPNLYRMVVR